MNEGLEDMKGGREIIQGFSGESEDSVWMPAPSIDRAQVYRLRTNRGTDLEYKFHKACSNQALALLSHK